MCEAKKFLAYWMEFLVDGNMSSGMNEENALLYVLKRAMEEQSPEIADDEESVGLSLVSSSFVIHPQCLRLRLHMMRYFAI